MRVDLFDFELPKDRIALRPASPRDSAKLLVVRGASLSDHVVLELPRLLRAGDVLVCNVTNARHRDWNHLASAARKRG